MQIWTPGHHRLSRLDRTASPLEQNLICGLRRTQTVEEGMAICRAALTVTSSSYGRYSHAGDVPQEWAGIRIHLVSRRRSDVASASVVLVSVLMVARCDTADVIVLQVCYNYGYFFLRSSELCLYEASRMPQRDWRCRHLFATAEKSQRQNRGMTGVWMIGRRRGRPCKCCKALRDPQVQSAGTVPSRPLRLLQNTVSQACVGATELDQVGKRRGGGGRVHD